VVERQLQQGFDKYGTDDAQSSRVKTVAPNEESRPIQGRTVGNQLAADVLGKNLSSCLVWRLHNTRQQGMYPSRRAAVQIDSGYRYLVRKKAINVTLSADQ
jgi:hypothetical protein